MASHRADMEAENTKLRSQLTSFESDLENIRGRIRKLTDENESLRHDLRRSAEERLSLSQPTNLPSLNNDSIIGIQKKQLELLEQERDDTMRLYEQSRLIIGQLEEEVSDLKHPLKPHLMKLDMQTKQAQEEHARAEVELIQEINVIREELTKRSRELVNCQLHVKELERQNATLQAEVYQKHDELRSHLKKEIGYDGTFVAFQSSIDSLEVRLEHALKEKSSALNERDEMESKIKDLIQQNRSLQERLSQAADQLHQHHQAQGQHSADSINHVDNNRYDHERMHRTIDELIEEAAVKTSHAVEEVRQQYNANLERIMQEYNQMEKEFNQKNLEFDKCLRAKRSVEEELEKIVQERRLHLEKTGLDNEDLAKRCFQAERERDETQVKFEQNQHAYKLIQQSSQAEKTNHELKQKELTERLQKVTNDLDRMTSDYTGTFNELNELKKRLSSVQNEQTLVHRRMAELVKRHEEQIIEKEKDCLTRLTQRDEVNRVTFNELRNLVHRQQRMIVKYKEECHTIAQQSETKINEMKQKVDQLRARNEQLQSEIGDVKRKDAEMNRILKKNGSRMKMLEERAHDAEQQAIETSRRVAKQLVRDRLAILPNDPYSHSAIRPMNSASLFNLATFDAPIVHSDDK